MVSAAGTVRILIVRNSIVLNSSEINCAQSIPDPQDSIAHNPIALQVNYHQNRRSRTKSQNQPWGILEHNPQISQIDQNDRQSARSAARTPPEQPFLATIPLLLPSACVKIASTERFCLYMDTYTPNTQKRKYGDIFAMLSV